MLTIAVLSSSPGCGKNTIMVNLGIGLQRKGFRVLLATGEANCVIRPWLNPTSRREISPGETLETTSLGVDLFTRPGDLLCSTSLFDPKESYDYLLADAGPYPADLCEEILAADVIIACIEAGSETQLIFDLEKRLRHLSQGTRRIDIIIPAKARAGEWENNVNHLMRLTEYFGEDRMADFIPFCEAIHDLPKEKKSVWDLPQNYSNRKQAFDRLIDYVLQQTSS